MEIELFVGLWVALCLGMGVSFYVALKRDNNKLIAVVLVTFVALAVTLFVVAAYMAPLWVAETLSGALKPL